METLSELLAPCEGNPPVISGSPLQSNAKLLCYLIVSLKKCWINSRIASDTHVMPLYCGTSETSRIAAVRRKGDNTSYIDIDNHGY